MMSEDRSRVVRKVIVASFLGNFVEWFDYATYSYLAVIISRVFFPQGTSRDALVQTFAIFALSFLPVSYTHLTLPTILLV